MARACYLEDLERAHLHELATLKAEQTATYVHEDELYGPYREGMERRRRRRHACPLRMAMDWVWTDILKLDPYPS
jgi:hypothetical protein